MGYIKEPFPATLIGACFFHLSQRLWRKIQEQGFASKYKKYENFEFMAKMVVALAFVTDKIRIFEYEKLLDYFLKTNVDAERVEFLF